MTDTRQALAALPPLPKTLERIDECGYPACRPAYTAEQMQAYARAALSAPPVAGAVATDESGWLIEHSGEILPGAEQRAQVSWLRVQMKFNGYGAREFGFTHDANEALRFSRREDAEAVLAMHLGASPPDWYSKPFSVTEHMWPAAAPQPQAAPAPEPSRSQKMHEAGFTARDTRLTCDECGAKFTRQFAPLHECAQPEPSAQAEQLEAMVDKAWLRFEAEDQRLKSKKSERVRALVNAGSFPGMSEAFDAHMGAECWTDPAYQPDASTWAAAWKAAKLDSAAQPSAQGEAVAQEWRLDENAAETLKQAIGDDDTVSPITLSVCHGHEGRGLYVWLTEYPEEGSLMLASAPAAPAQPSVTEEMVTAYLTANDAYWKRVDGEPTKLGKWRNGTPSEATRVSLMAALASAPSTPPPAVVEAVPLTDEQADALRRLWPAIEKAMGCLVFTAEQAGAVQADMNTIRHGIAPKAAQEKT